MFELKEYLIEKQKIINIELERLIINSDTFDQNQLLSAMHYSTMAGGKRIRPILCLSAAGAVGNTAESEILALACALEYIHTYSLIHDDLPAMDDDDLRRGNPTCHVRFDEATAVLAGDALLTFAFELLADLGCQNASKSLRYLQIIRLVADAAGHKGMVKGQMLDLLNEGKTITLDGLKNIHRLKTGALIRASVVSGAMAADVDSDKINELTVYADNIGLAFQVMDDILNIEGDPELMGKSVGTDLERDKCTYPALMGIEKSKTFAGELVNNALHAIGHFDNKADPLRAIATYIINRNK